MFLKFLGENMVKIQNSTGQKHQLMEEKNPEKISYEKMTSKTPKIVIFQFNRKLRHDDVIKLSAVFKILKFQPFTLLLVKK